MEISIELEALSTELRRLEAEYNMYFSGRSGRPPWETRSRVDQMVKRLEREYIETALDRFRFTTLQSRYATFTNLWDRALRAREEGRPGPFGKRPAETVPAGQQAKSRVVHVTSFGDPTGDLDKLHDLYDSLMDARHETGAETVPFHRFVSLVREKANALRQNGSPEVECRVAIKDGKVSFTMKAQKGSKTGG